MDVVYRFSRRIWIAMDDGNHEAAHTLVDECFEEVRRAGRSLSLEERLDLPLCEILPLRVAEALENGARVRFVRELVQLTPEQVRAAPNLGEQTCSQIVAALRELLQQGEENAT